MVGLLDVNVLVALLVPAHEHHALARRWVTSTGAVEGWATCPLTELGVIRVCAQLPVGSRPPRATADALTPAASDELWASFLAGRRFAGHHARTEASGNGSSVTDRYSLGLARRYGGRVVTCDHGLAVAGGDDVFDLLVQSS